MLVDARAVLRVRARMSSSRRRPWHCVDRSRVALAVFEVGITVGRWEERTFGSEV